LQKACKVNLTRTAQRDLGQIFSHISEDSFSKARKFILELEVKIGSLSSFPKRSPSIPENDFLGTNYRHLIHKKYRVIYRVEGKNVFVLRIIHGSKLLDL
jgi:plasmid stabilization system protein ParE